MFEFSAEYTAKQMHDTASYTPTPPVWQRTYRALASALLIVTLSSACGWNAPAVPEYDGSTRERGHVLTVEEAGTYSAIALRLMLWLGMPEHVPVNNSVRLYRITYWTELEGRAVPASGLLALPATTQPARGIVVWLHGTRPKRNVAPSTPTLIDGVLAAAVFAGGGFYMVAPDYLGQGVSEIVHPYLHAAATVDATVDMLIAARTVIADLQRSPEADLFVVGFSQGAHAAASLHRALESQSNGSERLARVMSLRATAAVAGPYDLAGISVPYAIENEHSLYLGFVARAYARYYRQPLESIIRTGYEPVLIQLFNGEHDADDIEAALPASPRDLFNDEFLHALENGKSNWFIDALRENEAYAWAPHAQLRLYYGERDNRVSPKDAKRFYAHARAHNGNIELISVGERDHTETALHAVPSIRKWFDAISARRAR
jgi:hypothetical protein